MILVSSYNIIYVRDSLLHLIRRTEVQDLGKMFMKKKNLSLKRDLNSLLRFHTQEPNHSATTVVAAGSLNFTYFKDNPQRLTLLTIGNPSPNPQPLPFVPSSDHDGLRPNNTIYTVFIRIVAAATINFSLAGVRLLIEGGSYSRTDFIYFGGKPLGRSDGILL